MDQLHVWVRVESLPKFYEGLLHLEIISNTEARLPVLDSLPKFRKNST